MAKGKTSTQPPAAPRIPHLESLHVENFRALHKVKLDDLTPLTVLVGPNGSGKSTVFEALDFLAQCFHAGLPAAWQAIGGTAAGRTRNQHGPIEIELTYREMPGAPLMQYAVSFDEQHGEAVVLAEELVQLGREGLDADELRVPILERTGTGVRVGTESAVSSMYQNHELSDPSELAAVVFGALRQFRELRGLRDFIRNWHISRLSLKEARTESEASHGVRLTPTGSNIASMVFFLQKQAPDRLQAIVEQMRRDVPNLAGIAAKVMESARMRLLIQDAPFSEPVPAQRASDGTLTLLAYLLLLQGGEPYTLLCLDEPENNLHPRLLPDLAESCRAAAERSQLLVITHSPEFLGGIRAEELRVLYRDEAGFTQAVRASDIRGIPELMAAGASLGQLWLEGHFGVGDPLVNEGRPQRNPRGPA